MTETDIHGSRRAAVGQRSAMAERPISPHLHGILDYATGAQLLMLPSVLRISGSRSSRVLRAAGIGHLVYAAVTKYDVGLVKLLPFRAHLALDAIGSAGLITAPWLLGTRKDGMRHWLPQVMVGLNDAIVTALTDPDGEGAASPAPDAAVAPAVENTSDASSGRTQETAAAEPTLSPPDPSAAVMPDGAEANDAIGARTVGGSGRFARGTGGVGSGTGPGSDPGVGGQQA
jgi:hypothetical protein